MKIVSMLLLMIFIIYFPIQAYSQCQGGVNPLYDEAVMPDQDFYVSSMQQKANSQSAVNMDVSATKPRIPPDERPIVASGSSGPNMSMPDSSPKPLVKPNTTANNQTSNASASLAQAQPEIMLIEVSDKWSVKFNDSTNRSLDLILFTNQERVMGSGTLVEDGTKIPLTASGSVSAKELTLTAKTVIGDYVNQIDRQFDLDLLMVNSTLSGTYLLKSAGKFLGKGNATMAKSGVS
jgi:hypothetical protein